MNTIELIDRRNSCILMNEVDRISALVNLKRSIYYYYLCIIESIPMQYCVTS